MTSPNSTTLLLPARRYLVLVSVIVAIAALLRILPLPQESFDWDEVFSRNVATAPLPAAMQAAVYDMVHPPLYYLLLKGWMAAFGTGTGGIRALSLTSGLLLIYAVAGFGFIYPRYRAVFLLACILIALNDSQIFFSQQARSYAFYSLMAVLLMLLAAALHEKSRVGVWIGTGITIAVLGYTHYVWWLYVLPATVVVWFSRWPLKQRARWSAAAVAAGAAFLPWGIAVLRTYAQRRQVVTEQPDNFLNLLVSNGVIGHHGLLGAAEAKYVMAMFVGVPRFRGGATIGFCALLMLMAAGLYCLWRKQEVIPRRITATFGAFGVAVPLLLFAATLPPLHVPAFEMRHTLPSQVFCSILASFGAVEGCRLARSAWARILVSGTAVMLVFLACSTTLDPTRHPRRAPYQKIAAAVAEEAGGGPCYSMNPFQIWLVNFYLGRDHVGMLPRLDSIPESFSLLYRPADAREKAGFDRMAAAGWQVRKRRVFTANRFDRWATEMVQMTRGQRLPVD
jgi:4-amino-4-deoxy-L-arabinose transferase-like glycosyltransferase